MSTVTEGKVVEIKKLDLNDEINVAEQVLRDAFEAAGITPLPQINRWPGSPGFTVNAYNGSRRAVEEVLLEKFRVGGLIEANGIDVHLG